MISLIVPIEGYLRFLVDLLWVDGARSMMRPFDYAWMLVEMETLRLRMGCWWVLRMLVVLGWGFGWLLVWG